MSLSKVFNYLSIALFGGFIINLFVTERLVFLTHPRYKYIILISGLVLIGFGIAGLWSEVRKKQYHYKSITQIINVNLLILIAAIGVYFVPIQTLSSDSFETRSTTANIQFTEEEKKATAEKIDSGVDTKEFEFLDWIGIKYLNNPDVFEGKEFKGVGFVTGSGEGREFKLSRFVLSCCAVDATPVFLYVEQDQRFPVLDDEWVKVEGEFETKVIEGERQAIIIPSSVEQTDAPKDAYITRN